MNQDTNIATEYVGTCPHNRVLVDKRVDTYDSEFGRDDILYEIITLTCQDCRAVYDELEEVWYV